MYLYSENTRVRAKWQWNARNCVTGLHDRRSRECNPVTPVECVSLSFRTHPCVLAFITYILCTHGIAMALMYLIQKTYSLLHIFQIRNLFHCFAESWWNMPFKGTRHGNGVADGAVAKLLRLWHHSSALWRHSVWIRIDCDVAQYMNGLWIFITKTWIAQINMIRTPSKQWGMCDKRIRYHLTRVRVTIAVSHDVLHTRWWCHNQNVYRVNETWIRCVEILLHFQVIFLSSFMR